MEEYPEMWESVNFVKVGMFFVVLFFLDFQVFFLDFHVFFLNDFV